MSQDTSSNNKRIAKNTLVLYVRMLFLMVVSLYTSRVVLNALGVEDYGIYSVVGGFVATFSVLTGSLSASISRFLTFELGKGESKKLNTIFSTSVIIQIGLSVIILVVAETIGLWFLNNKMVISEGRLIAANWCFQLSVVTFIINLISIPYNAAIIAHEKMSAFAYISIFEGISKLVIAWLIVLSPVDRLIYYAFLMALVALFVRIIYTWYCKRHFAECNFRFVYENTLLKQMLGFAGWNFIGGSAGVLRTQGLSVLINLFFGAVVNAARGISVQVNVAVASFASNFMTAINPQITKSYATGDTDYLNKLLFKGARLSFYLLLFLSLPILIETETILSLWLKIVPEHTIGFVRLTLLFSMCEAFSGPLITAMLATGDIKRYQIIVGGTNLLNIPLSYFLLKWIGFDDFPEITMVVAIFLSIVCLIQRLIMLREMINLNAKSFVIDVILKVFVVSLLSVALPVVLHQMMLISVAASIFNIVICLLYSFFIIFYVGCDKGERAFVITKVKNLRNRKK